ncbi:hypothetical protein L210DRAFT_3556080 [Boletus edulis BED1]|uniref:Uncharacterized protein n=1 Tax=Boletus edulis BED1 TaxID=1328754 RepID=A0AAD4GA99_BOLED|nr:hypothetical protein L210DRAFT_3556080 [Boletus edulis BED1]
MPLISPLRVIPPSTLVPLITLPAPCSLVSRNLGDLQYAISMFRHAVDLNPRSHPDKPMILHNPGSSLFTH